MPDNLSRYSHPQLTLEAAQAAYVGLLTLGDFPGRCSIEGQALLGHLRDLIASGTGKSDMEVQNEYEGLAMELRFGNKSCQ